MTRKKHHQIATVEGVTFVGDEGFNKTVVLDDLTRLRRESSRWSFTGIRQVRAPGSDVVVVRCDLSYEAKGANRDDIYRTAHSKIRAAWVSVPDRSKIVRLD